MIRDRTARRIACDWHGGQFTGLYALCSSGAITRMQLGNKPEPGESEIDAQREIMASIRAEEQRQHSGGLPELTQNIRDLSNLLAYVRAKGPRGPVDGWGRMPW